MSSSSVISLGAMRLQAKQKADMENNPAISTSEWNVMISNSYKELYDLLVAAYGNDYYVASPYQFTVGNAQLYSLPSDFYKLLGVDLQYSSSPSGWITLKRFEFIDRNKASYLNQTALISGLAQAWYVPEPTNLIFMPTCATTIGSTTVTTGDTSDLSAGMSVVGDGIAARVTISSITNATSFVISSAATATQPVVTLSLWTDAATIDGISGWEEYILVDAAIKSGIKQEDSVTDLRAQKKDMYDRITALAEGRDAGQACHVSDAYSVNGYSYGLNTLGIGNLRYHLLGDQIQFMVVDDDGGGYSGGGW